MHTLFYCNNAAAAAKSLQSCPTVRPHIRQAIRPPSPWNSPGKNTGVGCHFLLQCMKMKSQSRFSNEKMKSLSCVRLFATSWTVAYQAPPSMGFSGQECWSGLPFPFPGDLPDPGIEPGSPALQADTLTSEPPQLQGTTPSLRFL